MVIIYTTFPDEKTARTVTKKLLVDRLAACVQFFPIESSYWWRGKLEEANEIACFVKTKKSLQNKVIEFISKNHPYEAPEIITLPINFVNKAYFDWLNKETNV